MCTYVYTSSTQGKETNHKYMSINNHIENKQTSLVTIIRSKMSEKSKKISAIGMPIFRISNFLHNYPYEQLLLINERSITIRACLFATIGHSRRLFSCAQRSTICIVYCTGNKIQLKFFTFSCSTNIYCALRKATGDFTINSRCYGYVNPNLTMCTFVLLEIDPHFANATL